MEGREMERGKMEGRKMKEMTRVKGRNKGDTVGENVYSKVGSYLLEEAIEGKHPASNRMSNLKDEHTIHAFIWTMNVTYVYELQRV